MATLTLAFPPTPTSTHALWLAMLATLFRLARARELVKILEHGLLHLLLATVISNPQTTFLIPLSVVRLPSPLIPLKPAFAQFNSISISSFIQFTSISV